MLLQSPSPVRYGNAAASEPLVADNTKLIRKSLRTIDARRIPTSFRLVNEKRISAVSGLGALVKRAAEPNNSSLARQRFLLSNHRRMAKRIHNADWILPISSPPIRDGAVVTENDRIVFVGTQREVASHSEFRCIDGMEFGNAAILPGFVNTHSHLELTVMRGFLEDLPFRDWILKLTRTRYESLTSDDLKASGLLGAAEAIRAGITTLADTGDSASAFEALLASGLRGIAYREVFGPNPDDADKSLDGIKEKLDHMRARATNLVRVGVSPHAPYTVSAALFQRVAGYASAQSLDVCTHAAESAAEHDMLTTGTGEFARGLAGRGIEWRAPGMSTIRYLESIGVLETSPLLVHCVHVTHPEVRLMARYGARVAHCPKSNAKLGHGIAPLDGMIEAGVSVGLGTDSVASNNRCDILEEARFCGLIHRATSHSFNHPKAEDLLRLITIEAARTLRLDHEIGSLEAGKQADLIAIDLSKTHNTPIHDPASAIIYSAGASDVLFSEVAGQVLFDRELKTLDEADLKKQINAALVRMHVSATHP